jgi:hypothetical protein
MNIRAQLTPYKQFRDAIHHLKRLTLLALLSAGLVSCGGGISSSENQDPDPVVVDIPIAYIKRDLTLVDATGIRPLLAPSAFLPGASLVIKARANSSAAETDITSPLFADMLNDSGNPLPYDVKDLDTDYSGTRLVFAMRAPELPSMDNTPTWNIWEYDLTTETLRRLVSSDLVAEAGNDTGPTYLADGRVVFSSTRQRGNQARLLDEGKPQYSGLEESRQTIASVLHIMNADGTEISQISFNQSHDFDPVVLPSGKVLFSRWDRMNNNKNINLYKMNADGSDVEIVYGLHSHGSYQGIRDIQYAATSITPQGHILAAVYSLQDNRLGTDFIAIDTANYIDNDTPIASMPSLSGPAQQSALFDNIDLGSEVSPGGYITALYPLWDNSGRILFSWDQCRLFLRLPQSASQDTQRTIAPCNAENLASEDYEPAPSLYGLWMYRPQVDDQAATQLPLNVASEDSVVTEIVALESRVFPNNPITSVDPQETGLIANKYGVVHIQSVYDFDGIDTSPNGIVNMANPLAVDLDERPARFLRVVKSVSVPDEDTLDIENFFFGRSRNQLFREVVGYTPIQPDGSVKVAIPSGIPFAISVVNANGMRVSQRHNNWLQLMPGEQKNCIGCHTANSTAPHGRIDAQPISINNGAPISGLPFPNTEPSLFADAGETMAETLTRINGITALTANIEYDDVWTDPSLQTPLASFAYRYQDLTTPLPITQSCAQNWTSLCRAVINYPDHISPLFTTSRQVFDVDMNLLADNTCIACHSPMDENNMLRVPEGQLDLRDLPSADNADFLTSYRELLFNDNEQEVIDGALQDRLISVLDGNGDPAFEIDEDGELILDANDEPIPIFTSVRVSPSMRVNGAISSNRFFTRFNVGGSHPNMLSPAELRLLAEWLDIGGQNYNNPFDAPRD